MEQKRSKPCLGRCGWLIRPTRTRAADYPGTLALAGLGRCRKCREEMHHNGHAREEPVNIEAARQALESYLASRCRSKTVKVVRL